jgi:hypothetical protein
VCGGGGGGERGHEPKLSKLFLNNFSIEVLANYSSLCLFLYLPSIFYPEKDTKRSLKQADISSERQYIASYHLKLWSVFKVISPLLICVFCGIHFRALSQVNDTITNKMHSISIYNFTIKTLNSNRSGVLSLKMVLKEAKHFGTLQYKQHS